jgi:Tol biopolymer transport system component
MRTTPIAMMGTRARMAAAAAVLGASGAIGLALATSGDAAPAQASAAKQGKIAFARDDADGDQEIYVMKADGTGVTQLTDNDDQDRAPNYSSNGKRIAFVSDRDGSDDIWVMKANGSGQTQLTDDPDDDLSPSFSPDGRRIAWGSSRSGTFQVFIMNADGSDEQPLTPESEYDYGPKFSPNGKLILFTNGTDDDEVAVMGRDGSDPRLLTDNDIDNIEDYSGEWMPDGRRVVFQSDRIVSGDLELFAMKATGADQHAVTSTPAGFDSQSPSPTLDGRDRVIFLSDQDDTQLQVWSIKANGNDPRQLTDDDERAFGPDAAPTLKCGGKFATIIGTKKSEKLKGGAGKDVIAGLGGKDKLIGAGKKDVLCGGKGKDKFDAGGGKDTCIGGPAEDKAKGCNKLKQIP